MNVFVHPWGKLEILSEIIPDKEGTELTDILYQCDGDTATSAKFLLASVAAPKAPSERSLRKANQPGPSSSGISLASDELSMSGILQAHTSNMMSDQFFQLLVKTMKVSSVLL